MASIHDVQNAIQSRLQEREKAVEKLNCQIDTLTSLLEELKSKKRKRQIRGTLPDTEDDFYKLLQVLVEYDTQSKYLILLPCQWSPSEVCSDFFTYLEEGFDEGSFEEDIYKFKPFFDSGIKEIKLRVLGRKRSYKGQDTYFNKYNDIIDIDEPVLFAWYGGNNPPFEFFSEDEIYPCDDNVTDVDWNDWDTSYVEAIYTVYLFYLRIKDE